MGTREKILFILPNLEAGGAERVLLNYTRILKKQNTEIFLIIINDYGDLKNYIPRHVTLINLNIKRTRQAYFKLIKTINSIKPQYIFSTSNRTNLLLLMSKYFLLGRPKIIIREPNTPSAQFGENYLNSTYFKLMTFFYPKADLLVAQTTAMKKELIKLFGINKNKVRVIHNPIDVDYIDEKKNKNFNKFDQTKINIVASGRLHRQKGFDFLIEAFAEVVNISPDFNLFILGKKNGKENCTEELVGQINRMNLKNNVHLIGFQSNPYPFYHHADLFVLSSRWEGLPNVVLENLYLGTPVVATRCVPILENLIDDNINGRLCDFGDINTLTSAILNYSDYTRQPEHKIDNDSINEVFEI